MEHMSEIINNKTIKSPLRYPGGKGTFFTYFVELMKKNDLVGSKYYEPFAGGAGVALGLLFTGIASEAVLNDSDYHIYCFWQSVLNENERFIDYIHNAELSIAAWKKQKAIYQYPEKYHSFEVGFSTFYLNRCNRSGILVGAGPIGGLHQSGKWRLDARFNKENLADRIASIGKLKNKLSIYNLNAIDFLKQHLSNTKNNPFVYIDPPYVKTGNRLYLNFYQEEDHKILAKYILKAKNFKWIMTYDDTPLIRDLYSSCQKWLFGLRYSLQSKQTGKEILIAPMELQLPNKKQLTTKKWDIIKEVKKL